VSKMERFISLAMLVFLLWLSIGHVVFALRHPDFTDTQRLLHLKSVLLFEKVKE